MTSWHGHRDDREIPEAVKQVWREKFNPRQPQRPGNQSNVDLAVLDSAGRVVHWFDGFTHQEFNRRESLSQYTSRELKSAFSKFHPEELVTRKNPLNVPDLSSSRGIRLFVRLMDERMTAYQAPVVELVRLGDEDWKPLAWPVRQATVDAALLSKWLVQIYPPGIMERTDPQTKEAYRIKSATGNLSLTQAGSDETRRYAVLSGNVRLTDEGPDHFSYDGELKLVLGYSAGEPDVRSLRGVYEGIYPRTDRMQNRTMRIPLRAAIESRPDETR